MRTILPLALLLAATPATTVKITFDGSVTKIDGLDVIVERSDLC